MPHSAKHPYIQEDNLSRKRSTVLLQVSHPERELLSPPDQPIGLSPIAASCPTPSPRGCVVDVAESSSGLADGSNHSKRRRSYQRTEILTGNPPARPPKKDVPIILRVEDVVQPSPDLEAELADGFLHLFNRELDALTDVSKTTFHDNTNLTKFVPSPNSIIDEEALPSKSIAANFKLPSLPSLPAGNPGCQSPRTPVRGRCCDDPSPRTPPAPLRIRREPSERSFARLSETMQSRETFADILSIFAEANMAVEEEMNHAPYADDTELHTPRLRWSSMTSLVSTTCSASSPISGVETDDDYF